jgi:hypothetical protein
VQFLPPARAFRELEEINMNKSVAVLLLLFSPVAALANEQSACEASAGAFLTGTVQSAPRFATGAAVRGVRTSHTHVSLVADQDGKTYDVAMDNVFAADYVKNSDAVPGSLGAIQVGSRLELCGAKYTSGTGMHWVHNNCNATPSARAPNGWVKHIAANGAVGDNLESNQTYCYLWSRHGRRH